MSARGEVRTYLLLSLVAGAMVAAVALLGGDPDARAGLQERRVLGLALMLTACLGAVSAIRPGWWRGTRPRDGGPGEGPPDKAASAPPGPPRRGHHPECEAFAPHTITLLGRARCAGCTGLVAGVASILPLVWLYIAHPASLEPWDGAAMVLVGLALVALDLGAAMAGGVGPRAGLVLNALLVAGLALVSIGLLESTGDLPWGLLGVLLGLLWVDTRIQLSRWNHVTTCAVCPRTCVAYLP